MIRTVKGMRNLDAPVIIDVTDTEALLVRKESDGGDIFVVDTTNGVVAIGGVDSVTGCRLVLPQENDAVTPTLAFGDGNTGFYEQADNTLFVGINGNGLWQFTSGAMGGKSAGQPELVSETASGINPTLIPSIGDRDTGIGSNSADQLSLIAGAIEGVRVTEASSEITVDIDAGDNATGNVGALTSIKSTNVSVSSSVGATLTALSLISAGSLVLGVTTRITTAFGTSTSLASIDIGDGSDVDRWGAATAITVDATTDMTDATGTQPAFFASANDIVLTGNGGNFDSTGVIEILVHYITLTAPTG